MSGTEEGEVNKTQTCIKETHNIVREINIV